MNSRSLAEPAFAADFLTDAPKFNQLTPHKFVHIRQKIISQHQTRQDSGST